MSPTHWTMSLPIRASSLSKLSHWAGSTSSVLLHASLHLTCLTEVLWAHLTNVCCLYRWQ